MDTHGKCKRRAGLKARMAYIVVGQMRHHMGVLREPYQVAAAS